MPSINKDAAGRKYLKKFSWKKHIQGQAELHRLIFFLLHPLFPYLSQLPYPFWRKPFVGMDFIQGVWLQVFIAHIPQLPFKRLYFLFHGLRAFPAFLLFVSFPKVSVITDLNAIFDVLQVLHQIPAWPGFGADV